MINKLLTAIFDFFINISTLAEGAQARAPQYLTRETAVTHALAAKIAEAPGVSAELLLAMAYVESRYDSRATSRVRDGERRTGIPKWESPPKGVTGPYFCGVTQAIAGHSWKRCLELRDLHTAYQATAGEIKKWLGYCRNDITCALTGYGGGFPAIKAGTSTYPARVLSRARAIRKAASS